MLLETDKAWLAGFIDGEGSVGLTRDKTTLIPTLQITTTCKASAGHLQHLLSLLIGRIPAHFYQEKHPDRHRDAYYIRVTGISRIQVVSQALLPYSVTKASHWKLLIEFMAIRLSIADIDHKGNIKRGGKHRKPYGPRELEIYHELRRINRRGPRTDTERAPSCLRALGTDLASE